MNKFFAPFPYLVKPISSRASADADAEIYIDPHDLTGKKGLERMMTCIDSKSPPEKGSFEYKRSTLDTYDRIFSKELIVNYSSKIKSILDKIVEKYMIHTR